MRKINILQRFCIMIFLSFKLIIWSLIITSSAAHKVFDSTEDIGPEAFLNVTTLYPVPNNESPNKTSEIDKNKNENETKTVVDNNVSIETYPKEDKTKIDDATIWKIDAAFADSNLEDNDKENTTDVKAAKKNETKEFKPSQHLGNFYDEDNFRIPTTKASFVPFTPVLKPSAGFVSTKDDFRSPFTIPKQILQSHKQFPYKFESPILTRSKTPWRSQKPDSLESKPTVEAPVRVPAGGYYKYEDPFKDKPGSDSGDPFRDKPEKDEDFGLSFNKDEKDNDSAVKKRESPWESFLRLVTAFLPVGLVISALTPSLITIEPAGPAVQGHAYPSLFRRSEPGVPELPAISERCRRRLLCELHSDYNYTPSDKSPGRRRKQCYKIHCEDSEALAKTLQWLLEYRRTTHLGQT